MTFSNVFVALVASVEAFTSDREIVGKRHHVGFNSFKHRTDIERGFGGHDWWRLWDKKGVSRRVTFVS